MRDEIAKYIPDLVRCQKEMMSLQICSFYTKLREDMTRLNTTFEEYRRSVNAAYGNNNTTGITKENI